MALQKLPQEEPGVDIAISGPQFTGITISLTADALNDRYDMNHPHAAFVAEYDGGKMDGEDKVQASGSSGCVLPSNPGFKFRLLSFGAS